MSPGDAMRHRTFRTDDPAVHARLDYAWQGLEDALANGDTAAQLDTNDLDYILGDLMGIRHRRLPGAEPGDGFRTEVSEGDGWMVLESHIRDQFGNEFRPTPPSR
jgi:hypothetical protein